jgi:Dyp-type peroxidase family
MSLNLTSPFAWRKASATETNALKKLQGNILKGHGRENTANIFLRFDAADARNTRKFIAILGAATTDALSQLQSSDKFKATGKSGAPFVALMLSHTGYVKLAVPATQIPNDAAFKAGLKAKQASLSDPAVTKWQPPFRGDIDAMLLVGGDSAAVVKQTVAKLLVNKPASLVVLSQERGHARKNSNGDGMEHFGYVDGRSQPLLLAEDIEHERTQKDGIHIWDPAFPLGQALVPCPGGGVDDFGSYFVFRKLEQNVKGFKKREEQLATKLGLKGDDRERAGALVVGRFEDGTPVLLQHGEGMHNPVPNNFNYEGDTEGRKCPFQGHVRKANPRGESAVKLSQSGVTVAAERAHIMARRGITYEEPGKKRKTKKVGEGIEFLDQPNGGVGLFFMAYQSDIANQFEFTQQSWANNAQFVAPATGVDPVIGQGASAAATQKWPKQWGEVATVDFGFQKFVTMLGGEYFFAPCKSFLVGLSAI